jgi:hypothetical protein
MEFVCALFECLERVGLGFWFGDDNGCGHNDETKQEIPNAQMRKTVETVCGTALPRKSSG